jgi:hypothetical protein
VFASLVLQLARFLILLLCFFFSQTTVFSSALQVKANQTVAKNKQLPVANWTNEYTYMVSLYAKRYFSA